MQKISMFAIHHHGDKAVWGTNHTVQTNLADEQAPPAASSTGG